MLLDLLPRIAGGRLEESIDLERGEYSVGQVLQEVLGPEPIVYLRFFEQKTAYEILRGDWSSDVCSSD
eukprot:COSAG04_NODE_13055_length_622_cov_0.856597_1_plen_67_part_10